MSSTASIPLAPGCVPVLGHAPALLHNPLAFLASLPGHGDLLRIRAGTGTVVMVCDPVLTRQVLADDRTFDKGGPVLNRAREMAGDGLGTCPHERHRRLRRLCQPSFRHDRFPAYAAAVTASVDATARSWHDGQIIDPRPETHGAMARAAVETLVGNTLPPRVVQQAADDLTALNAGILRGAVTPPLFKRIPTPGNRRFQHARTHLQRTFGDIITARRADGTDHGDLLSSLLQAVIPEAAHDSRVLTDDELVDQLLTFFFSGTETTADTLSWALHLLARHPEIADRLHSEADSLPAGTSLLPTSLPALQETGRVVRETLRLYPPAWLTTRTVTKDSELGGHSIPAGTALALSPYLIHHRPDLYREPDRFVPDRWRTVKPDRTTYIPFGSGARTCIAEHFALGDITLALTAFTTRWRLTPATKRPVRTRAFATLRPRGLLRVIAREKACR
ncbi:cytochrome P450 [Streptomyces sp. ET3-23]|uniref:cytochrome P450 n=1 Tax=Streptomyces sp. ET3-23 TaxID=2885643 RepID=UPI001D0FF05E|nr:cytochrome P450 [Streptomyces sp. ET3-23]MCC2277725.1 cytochrome P450 [Streptomyces sp. ET3-23]